MSDLIDRQQAIDRSVSINLFGRDVKIVAVSELENLPSAQPERKMGKWSEKEVIHKEEADKVIEEWQSCRCPECGRYDTRPYLYYFDEPHFCSWCGADMRGDNNG